ncbi:uncharacterized protein LOC128872716 [Hylaeus volcanicus]|uniref:uncharacterized protein LOC128872716 n=1 Tax=Hylaeus volcanicus TaxID=313075 RepID=UPI0023B799C9|nr:uncharacterized protein LOC128872716 [Hylaeus volcanicus]
MRNSALTDRRLFDALHVLIVFSGVFSVALSAVSQDRGLYHRSPNFDDAESTNDDFLAYMLDRWRSAQSPEVRREPQIAIQLLKSHAQRDNDDLTYEVGYKYAENGKNTMEKNKNCGNGVYEKTRDDKKDQNEAKFDGDVPAITSRTIIDPPAFECPAGQRPDSNGQCRDVIEM